MKYKFRNINIELSSVCNFDCAYCPDHKMTRKKQVMDYDLAKSLIDQISEMKLTNNINFYHMGESLLNPKAIEIFKYTKEKGLKIKLNTNGSLLTSNNRKKLLEIGVDNIYISYHESYVKHKKFIKKKPFITFEKWHKQIISLIEEKYQLDSKSNIVIILFKSVKALNKEQTKKIKVYNDDAEITNALKIWLDIGKKIANEYSLPYLFNIKNKNLIKRLIFKFIERMDRIFPVIPGFNINLIKVHTWNNDIVSESAKVNKFKKAKFGSCDALRDSMAIFADGSYSLCCADWNGNVVIGNAVKQDLQQFLKSKKVKTIQKSFSQGKLPFQYCKECRGAYTYKSWLFNQFHSYLYYNNRLYKEVRNKF